MLFARDLEVMTNSGMQLLHGIEMIRNQSRSKNFKKILDQLVLDLKNGQFLSTSLERYKNIFGDFFINLIRVGETSGTLSENLKYLSEELKKKDELQKKVKGAMVYPVVILVATLAITGILTFVIFPKILPILKSINVPLPVTTRAFIFISDFLFRYGVFMGVGLVILVIGVWFLLKVKTINYAWNKFLLELPLVGNMIRTVNIVNFSRTLGLLLKSGVNIVETLEISSSTLKNPIYKAEVKKMADGVRKGDTLSKYMVGNDFLFTPIFSEMVTVGENTGKLDESILFISNYYEGEFDEVTRSLSNFMEPALLLVMGFVVGFVALAIITPIYSITQTLGR